MDELPRDVFARTAVTPGPVGHHAAGRDHERGPESSRGLGRIMQGSQPKPVVVNDVVRRLVEVVRGAQGDRDDDNGRRVDRRELRRTTSLDLPLPAQA